MKKSEELALHKEIRNSFVFDRMKMLLCLDYVTKDGIIVRQPRIGEIVEIGEEVFYRNLNTWVTNPTSYRAPLWHMDIDWCKITDFELFCNLYQAIDAQVISLIFPNTDISSYEQKYKVTFNEETQEEDYELVLYSEKEDQVIDNMAYLEISQYLRTLFNIFPKDEYGKGRSTKESMIWEDEDKARRNQDQGFKSSLFPLVSACINHPGFKHSLQDLPKVGIYEFMDSVNRIQVMTNTEALIMGSTNGLCDMSKVPRENFNLMRDIYVTDTKKGNENALNSVMDNFNKK